MSSSEQIGNIFFFGFLSFFLFLGYLLFEPFLKVITLSILITIIFYPVYVRILSRLKSKIIASLLMTALIFMFIIIPSIILVAFLINQIITLYPLIIEKISKYKDLDILIKETPVISKIYSILENTLNSLNIRVDISDAVRGLINEIVSFVIQQGKGIFVDITLLIIGIVIMLVTIFFLFKDGQSLYNRVYSIIPLSEKDKSFLISKSYRAIQGVVLGSVLTAIAQGILSFIGYFAIGLEMSYFWAFITFVAAFIPVGGASLIWVPIAIYTLLSKGFITAFLFALYGTFVISTIDNIIKPVVIGDKTDIHPMILVFAIIGGLNMFGFLGVFLAPIIMVMIDNMLLLFREKYVTKT
ncbi:Predicted PurR-regulated permease PerM [Persephonella hydrogeniphila]|uniref:Predicted PurR-regulated permease PerM n=1 Tax=Persephonella hydrogeniphila TaxID=198703 RepID=A0A285NKU1_9AQUI|nr:AI-2E family transporter [Persephonella hydrogeniphila]SNZ10075.1 Predicted PurR-regulated permease PerM [Persephonella hydrogeniphila]